MNEEPIKLEDNLKLNYLLNLITIPWLKFPHHIQRRYLFNRGKVWIIKKYIKIALIILKRN
jgi:hypothetical protein